MNQAIVKRILDIQELLCTDASLMGDYESSQTAFLEMLSELSEKQQDILMDFLGVCIELHLRMLEKWIEIK